MDSIMDIPRECCLSALYQMLSFLKSKHNCATLLDPAEPKIDQTQFPTEDWSKTSHGPCRDDTPSNTPTPNVTSFAIRVFVDSDHAIYSISCRSRTSFIVFLNIAPIFVHSKKKGMCEISSFGS